MTRIIGVSNHKGGVGKTTSALNIGEALSQKGHKILLIDLDPQANLSQSLGVEEPEQSIYDALKGTLNVIHPHIIHPHLHLIPATLDLSAAEIELSAEPGREYLLKGVINILKHNYDYVIIDCPPSLGLLTINALTAASTVLIPLQAEYLPLRGLAKLNEVIEKIKVRLNNDLSIGAVFLTKYDQRRILNRDTAISVGKFFGEKLMTTTIANNVALAEAPSAGQSIFAYSPKSRGAEDYAHLCDEMLQKKVI
jgi:chromosome partitioning protein